MDQKRIGSLKKPAACPAKRTFAPVTQSAFRWSYSHFGHIKRRTAVTDIFDMEKMRVLAQLSRFIFDVIRNNHLGEYSKPVWENASS